MHSQLVVYQIKFLIMLNTTDSAELNEVELTISGSVIDIEAQLDEKKLVYH